MTPHKAFAVFDGDTHVVEPPAVWEAYLAPEFRTPGKTALWRGMFGFIVSRNILPLTLRYEP